MTEFLSKFTHHNFGFTCESCGKTVPPRKTSCRNHCPFCLCSKHVDIYPGDRANQCHGLMNCVGYHVDSKKGLILIFKCRKCQKMTQNIAANEDPIQADNYDAILALSQSKRL